MVDAINPTINLIAPVPDSINNPLDQSISFELLDDGYGSGINLSTLIVTVNGEYAVQSGSFQSGFTGSTTVMSATQVGIVVSRTAPFIPLESVNVAISIRDNAGNPASTLVFSFIALDNVPPQIINLIPQPGTTQVPATQQLSFQIRSTPRETPIDINTLVVSMGGLVRDAYGNIVLDGYGDPELTVFIQPDSLGQISYDHREVIVSQNSDGLGWSVTIQPIQALPLSSLLSLNINVQDAAANLAELSYTFATIDEQPPTITNEFPVANSISNSLATPVGFSIGDRNTLFVGSGVDIDSLQVRIDSEVAMSAGEFVEGFSGVKTVNSVINGYDIFIMKDQLFPPRKTINVEITVADNSENVVRSSYAFFTEDVQAPQIIFVYPQLNVTNVPQSAILIVDIVSEVAIEEIDLNTIVVSINGSPVLQGNTFNGFTGSLTASTSKILTITLENPDPYALGSTVTLDIQASDVFGNQVVATNVFNITTNLALSSVATPAGGIYDRTDQNLNFPQVGSFLDVVLTSNRIGTTVAYTLDGSLPQVDGYYNPLGTTQFYSTPIRFLSSTSAILRHFAFDTSANEIENEHADIYVFTDCAEIDKWISTSLRDGLEYTDSPRFLNSLFIRDVITNQPGKRVGFADYVHDIGRLSYIDTLSFTTFGITHFRVRIADRKEDLPTTEWLNSVKGLAIGNLVSLQDGYGTTIRVVDGLTRIEGRKATTGFFNDEATATLTQPLLEAFTIQGDMRLDVNIDAIIGASSFFRVYDDTYTLQVEEIISKTNTTGLVLTDLNSLVGETPILFLNGVLADGYFPDGYEQLTDGYSGFVVKQPPATQLTETLDFMFTKTEVVGPELVLEEDTTGVFELISVAPGVYNTFNYNSGVVYSSALVGTVYYKRFVTERGQAFAIGVTGKPLDITLARVVSENLNPITDRYEFAETNDVFNAKVFLEAGDYNFRFQVTNNDGTRFVGNPFQFTTKQNLSTVLKGDVLVVGSSEYLIESVAKLINDEYVFEFTDRFPETVVDILTWTIKRGLTTFIVSTAKIVIKNPLNATLGSDATGKLGNIIVNTRSEIEFTYISSSATGISVLGTFNRFDPRTNILAEGFDPNPIAAAFDLNLSTIYENATTNTHRVVVEPFLPMIVDRVRFYTGVASTEKQRTRLFLDSQPISNSTYRAYKEDDTVATYANTVDVLTSASDGFDEWRYVQVGLNTNRTFRNSIGLSTRFDSYSGHSRKHKEIQIFTLPTVPQIVADFVVPANNRSIQRSNKTAFAAPSNYVTVKYSREQQLDQVPIALNSVEDDGVINNFLRSTIVAPGETTTSIYVDKPYLFKENEAIVVYDNPTVARTTVITVDLDTGRLDCTSAIPQQGIVVKDYAKAENDTSFLFNLEIPNFQVIFYGTIYDFGTTIQLGPDPNSPIYQAGAGETVLVFENFLSADGSVLLGGKLTYPLLPRPAEIVETSIARVIIDSEIKEFIVVTIDQQLLVTHDELGAIVESFNTTKVVTDYSFSKADGVGKLLNESLLSSGLSVDITYQHVPIEYQVPRQTYCFAASPSDIIEIRIEPTQYKLSLDELASLTVNFFNGVDAQAPSTVTFIVNDQYAASKTLAEASITDGYTEGLYDSNFPETGQIVKFSVPISEIVQLDSIIDGYEYVDGYGDQSLDSVSIKFTGQTNYCIGEIEALAESSLINSICRVTLNRQELFRSPLQVNSSFIRIQIQVEHGVVFVYFNGANVVRRPMVFQNPHFQFGATGKVFDDGIKAEFKNIFIDQFFTSSPAAINQTGRFIEIEGTVIS